MRVTMNHTAYKPKSITELEISVIEMAVAMPGGYLHTGTKFMAKKLP